MIGLEGKTLVSPRLQFRLLAETDKPALRRILSDPAVTVPGGFYPAKTESEFDAFFAGMTALSTALGVFALGKLIGYIYVGRYPSQVQEALGKSIVSVGFVIGKEVQEKGYGTEMLQTVTDYLLTRFDAVVAEHFAGNEASHRVLIKSGFRFFREYTAFFPPLQEEKAFLCFVRTGRA